MSKKTTPKEPSEFDAVLQMLSAFQVGDFSKKIPQSKDKNLNQLIEKIHETAKSLSDQSQTNIEPSKFLTLSLDLLCIASTDGTFKKINPAFTRVLGFSETELLSKSFLEFVHPDDIPSTLKEIERLASGQETVGFENRYRTKAGSYRTLSWSVSPDKTTGFLSAAARDVTDQKTAMRENERLLQRLEEAELISKIGFWELNLDTYQGKWSKGQLRLFGLNSTQSAPTFEKFMNFVHPDDRGMVQNKFTEVLKTKQATFSLEFRIQLDNGKTIRWMKEHGKLELNKEGKPIQLSGSVQDITEAKNAELEMTKTLAILNETSKLAKIGGWELDLKTGKQIWSTETFYLFEMNPTENREPSLKAGIQLYIPEHQPLIEEAVTRAINLGEPYSLELQALTQKGNLIWVHAVGKANQANGKTVSISGTIQDITTRKLKDIEEKEREARINALFEQSADAIMTIAPPSWKFTSCNKAALKLFGVPSREAFQDLGPWSLSPDMQPDGTHSAEKAPLMIARAMETGSSSFHWLHQSTSGTPIPAEVLLSRIDFENSSYLQATVRDVSAQVKAEKEKEEMRAQMIRSSKLASLGEMSAGIAHEINNPLAIIAGSVGLLSKLKANPEKLAAKISTIEKSCERIAKIVTGLRKFSRTGETKNYQNHSLQEISREVITLTETKSKRHDTLVTLDCSIEASIYCDEIEIEQVLVNLINNSIDAVKSKPEKWVKISILENKESIILRVVDSGQGIPLHVRSKLFDPFFTTKKVGEGTGLGLSISKGILDDHNATITVALENQHTCFEIRFPKLESKKNAA